MSSVELDIFQQEAAGTTRCLFIMFMVAGGGDTTRVQRQERKKVRKYSVYLFRRRSSSSCGSCGSWRAPLTQTCPFFSQVFWLFFATADPPSHNLDVVALSSFFTHFTLLCSFPVALSSE